MSKGEIKKVLVANRGEIAVRVFRACKELGLSTVAIYAKEDAYNLFRTKADASYVIGMRRTPLGAYLDIEDIIHLAKSKNVDAIHPGYGFLSENANFAKACEENGIIFIGPPSHVLEKMGDKLSAKEIAKACNVPTIPGSTNPLPNADAAAKTASEYGYPVILKAAAGGGGKGMRRADNEKELRDAFGLVESEAQKSFDCGDIFIEKYLVAPKHIEIQVIADKEGNVVHLYERDCSLQRRYQKVVEVAPAVSMPKDVLSKMYADAVAIAKKVNYVSAGTVEFLYEPRSGNYYFIEMNPRIQVEHTISELITGIDIVQTQIHIADGRSLSDKLIGIAGQEDISVRGAAIQCRVTTEDPSNNFAPDVGKITDYRSPGGYGVRLDTGNAFAGAEILPYYDSLLVKVTAFDRTFEGAIRRARRALGEMRVQGIKTNIRFLSNILDHPKFAVLDCSTTFIDDTEDLYKLPASRNRDTKILTYIANQTVNSDTKHKYVLDLDQAPVPVSASDIKSGLKQMLDDKGPKAVCDYIIGEKRLMLADTTMRDAMQSLLATRVRTRDIIAPADYIAKTIPQLFALEMWGGATFDVAYRFLQEDPWERLMMLRERIPNILFTMLLRGANAVGYTSYPDNVVRKFIEESAKAGMDVFRIFDSLNWIPNMELSIDEVLKQNKIAEGYICYTGDISDTTRDKYDLKYYVEKAKTLEKLGVHILGIKDMSGLLKPYAAEKLVKALKNEIGLPLHLHTHDTSGNGVAMILKAAEAGVDIVDTAIQSMSSLTSQPSMNAVVTALHGHARDTGIDDEKLLPLATYWEQARKFYPQFEEGLTTPTTDVYKYEIPGGQYTNLRAQVESIGLGSRWQEVKDKYKHVNDMLGDIVKVTPSSKMVGDFAIFMVQNNLTAENIAIKGKNLAYPDSVVSYFEGMMGQPEHGFPEDIKKIVLKGKKSLSDRPGKHLAPVCFDEIATQMQSFCDNPTMQDVMGYCMYPKVVEAFYEHRNEYSNLTNLETPVFYNGLKPGRGTEVEIDDGKTLLINLIFVSDLEEDNRRRVVFELNGHMREISVIDKTVKQQGVISTADVMIADPKSDKDIGATLTGMVSKIMVSAGDAVSENDVVAIIEAMKMETTILAKCDGVVELVVASEGQTLKAGDLIMRLE